MNLRDRVQITGPNTEVTYDERGNEVPGGGEPLWEPAQVTPVSSAEQIVGRDRVTSLMHIILLPGTSATQESTITWRGDAYQVEGEVERNPDARGRIHHCSAYLTRAEG